ncbi:hypothetical protein IQ243_08985 [Nostocales cyanobacterium LEGE 11386]|nr:hypothetical protein [Nostocales cyanobacterium LEGE 11386]
MPSVFSLANSIIFAESEPEKLVQGFLSATAIDVQEIESRLHINVMRSPQVR